MAPAIASMACGAATSTCNASPSKRSRSDSTTCGQRKRNARPLPLVDALPELMTPASAALGVPCLGQPGDGSQGWASESTISGVSGRPQGDSKRWDLAGWGRSGSKWWRRRSNWMLRLRIIETVEHGTPRGVLWGPVQRFRCDRQSVAERHHGFNLENRSDICVYAPVRGGESQQPHNRWMDVRAVGPEKSGVRAPQTKRPMRYFRSPMCVGGKCPIRGCPGWFDA